MKLIVTYKIELEGPSKEVLEPALTRGKAAFDTAAKSIGHAAGLKGKVEHVRWHEIKKPTFS